MKLARLDGLLLTLVGAIVLIMTVASQNVLAATPRGIQREDAVDKDNETRREPRIIKPPKVTILSPHLAPAESLKRLGDSRLTVVAVAQSASKDPVKSITLLVNGRPIKQAVKPKADSNGIIVASWPIELAPGKNSLRVIAGTVEEVIGTSDELFIFVEGAAGKPKMHILSIGVSDYQVDRLKLKFGHSDAIKFAKTLSAGAAELYDVQPPVVLTDKSATKKAIVEALAKLSESAGPSDLTMIFFSGHGARVDDTVYLVAVDGDPEDFAGTCLTGKDLKDSVAKLKGKVMVILDAEGASRIEGLVIDFSRDDVGVFVFAASQRDGLAFEQEEWGGGAFGTAICEGLEGKADLNDDGFVGNLELAPYVHNRVAQLTEDKQHPVFGMPLVKPFRLVKVKPAEK